MNTLAKIISIVFQPLFVPTYGLLLLFSSNLYNFAQPYKWVILLFFASCTCIIPLICSLVLYSPKSLTELDRKRRHIIYIITVISYAFCFYLLWKFRFPFVLLVVYAGCVFAVFLLTIVNFFWKISAHASVIGCLCGYVFLVSLYFQQNPVVLFCTVVLLAGIIGWARLQLKAHTFAQVFCGYALGMFPSIVSLPLFL